MGKNAPKPPPQVDPVALAAAQSKSNIDTATAQQKLNMINTTDQYGSVRYEADPTAPGGYRQVTELSPGSQKLYDTTFGHLDRINQALSQPFSYEGLPDLVGSIDKDWSADRDKVEQALYSRATSRLDPQWQQREDQLDTKLANQGLGINSSAAQTARMNFGQERNDAYAQALNDAILAGGQEQSRLFGIDQAAAQFQNQARTQGAQEQAFAQNLPINQFSTLLNGGQVAAPTGINYTPSQVAPTDISTGYDINSKNYATQAQAAAQNNAGVFGALGKIGGALIASDRRLKTNIVRLGRRGDGLGVYAYRYVWGGPAQVGVMADEVARVYPHAVHEVGGYLAVDYGALV